MPTSDSSGFLCGSSSFHPYECDGPGKCLHCDRNTGQGHDPRECALCDPEYDFAPNPYWGKTVAEIEDWEPTR